VQLHDTEHLHFICVQCYGHDTAHCVGLSMELTLVACSIAVIVVVSELNVMTE